MKIHELPILLNSCARPSEGCPVWFLETLAFWPFGKRQREKDNVVSGVLWCILSQTPTFLVTDENPADWELPGSWSQVLPNTWRVPSKVSPQDIAPILEPGHWSLVVAESASDWDFPWPFHARNHGHLVATLSEAGVRLFVTSEADNREWVIAIPDGSTHS